MSGSRGRGQGDTWHLACGSVWRGLELITDHMHSEQTLTDTTIISTQQYLHSNIYSAHLGRALGVLIRLIIEAVLPVLVCCCCGVVV